MTLRHTVALVAAVLLLCVGGCGDDQPAATDPTPTGDASPAQVATATPSGQGFDEEAWRREAIKRFGEEPVYTDGSKLDYVDTAHMLCAQEQYPDYDEGSLQAYMVETFCPNV